MGRRNRAFLWIRTRCIAQFISFQAALQQMSFWTHPRDAGHGLRVMLQQEARRVLLALLLVATPLAPVVAEQRLALVAVSYTHLTLPTN